MPTIDLRALFAELSTLPRHLTEANNLTEELAVEIADKFGETLDDVRREFVQANESAAERARFSGASEGAGGFPNAYRLFFGYLYDLHYEAHCESQEAARREFQDGD